MGLGAGSAGQAYLDAIVKHVRVRVDTSATLAVTCILNDPIREWVIEGYSLSYDVVMDGSNAPNAINVGISGTAAAVAAITPYISGAVATPDNCDGQTGSTFTNAAITHGTTYVSTRNTRDKGRQVIPKNTPIYVTHTADSNTGECTLHVRMYPLDSDTMR